jgi:hypothetical protein
VYHCEGLRITSFRHAGERARCQQQGAPRECCHKVSGHPAETSIAVLLCFSLSWRVASGYGPLKLLYGGDVIGRSSRTGLV